MNGTARYFQNNLRLECLPGWFQNVPTDRQDSESAAKARFKTLSGGSCVSSRAAKAKAKNKDAMRDGSFSSNRRIPTCHR